MIRPANEIFFISDLHIGHKAILTFAGKYREGESLDDHHDWLLKQWNSVVRPNDLVYVLGDVCFGKEHLYMLHRLHGYKNLVRGNHDQLSTSTYLEYFNHVYGLFKWERFWLSHAPIHPAELRGKMNMHGHVHQHSIPDPNYLNVCVENLRGIPISATRLREIFYTPSGEGHKAPEFVLSNEVKDAPV